jgi:hypothetical protein
VAWGENHGAEHRAGELIHPTQPRDLLPGRQAELFDGIHLPDGVRVLDPLRSGSGFAARGSGRLAVASEPALQGTGAGQRRELGLEVAQTQTQIGGSPTRVLLVQQQRLLDRRPGRPRRGPWIGGRQCRGPVLVEGVAEAADRAGRQPQLSGQDTGRGSLFPQREEALTHGVGQRCGHKSPTNESPGETTIPENVSPPLDGGQTGCRN